MSKTWIEPAQDRLNSGNFKHGNEFSGEASVVKILINKLICSCTRDALTTNQMPFSYKGQTTCNLHVYRLIVQKYSGNI
jgi:hypothetical protein